MVEQAECWEWMIAFSNRPLLTGIKQVKTTSRIHTHAGVVLTNLQG